MSTVLTHDPVIIALTDNAAEKVKNLIEEEGKPSLKLRVFVTGGGCSGFQYGFSFDEAVGDDDTVIDHKGARVDYVENLEGARFVVNNPMASTTCGCGSSFSI